MAELYVQCLGNQTPRITAQNLRELDWTQIDRRIEDGKFLDGRVEFFSIEFDMNRS